MTKARECGTKERLTKTQARAKAHWWRRVRFAHMSEYHCSKCDGWHVGHWRPTKRRKVRR